MCGITGFWTPAQRWNDAELQQMVQQMGNQIYQRGPDSSGEWQDATCGIALGHRRLAIVDLSPTGHQPMLSQGDRYVLTFNGEIYNFPTLRRELEWLGHSFRGSSDTEIMLAAFLEWGIAPAVMRFNGMFAFALWDSQTQTLTLGRDRMGEKPLYYGLMGDTFLFGSELKALKAHPRFNAVIDRNALALFLRHNYVPGSTAIYSGISKLLPATLLTITAQQIQQRQLPEPIAYWSLAEVCQQGAENPFTGSETEAIDQLDDLLQEAIKLRMMADVPLGAFLSGGIDSSTVVAMMQRHSDRPVKTFTIGFNETKYNEATYAKAIAQHLGTDHTELYVTPQQSLEVIPQLPTLYDEPFADSSQIPTFLVSRLARRDVTVTLSGDAGDELLAGYSRYQWSRDIWNQIRWMPQPLRRRVAQSLTAVSTTTWDHGLAPVNAVLPAPLKRQLSGDRLHKIAEVIATRDSQSMYQRLTSHWKAPQELVLGLETMPDCTPWLDSLPNFTEQMSYCDMMMYLPDDILVKVDRASMGVSLESRIPMLDHHLIEFTTTLPLHLKTRKVGNQSQGKWILRQVLDRYVPRELFDRPKTGFGIPLDSWLRTELKEWAYELIRPDRLINEGFFDPEPILKKWDEHQSGDRNWHYYLWDILMFQAWLEVQ